MKIAIIGARGYLGREATRLLIAHPHVDEVIPVTTSGQLSGYADTVPSFLGVKGLHMHSLDDDIVAEADAYILATASGQAAALMPRIDAWGSKVVIDLSRDHRLQALAGQKPWSYGLVESPHRIAQGTNRVANPGCYPTATLLALGPALAAGHVGSGPIIVDGKSGISGAGATPRPELHYTEAHDSVRAYKVLGHDHEAEIQGACSAATKDLQHNGQIVRFTPHLVPMSRGLQTTVYAPLADDIDPDDVRAAYAAAYADTPFVSLVDEAETKHVRLSNRAHVAVDVDTRSRLIVARGTIDNLLKGGAGQAIQNLNLTMDWDETIGLPMIGAIA